MVGVSCKISMGTDLLILTSTEEKFKRRSHQSFWALQLSMTGTTSESLATF